MPRFFHLVKLGFVFGGAILCAALALNFAFVDIVEKTERFTVTTKLNTLQDYFKVQLVELEVIASEWASSKAVSTLYKKNNSKSRRKLLKSKSFIEDRIDFISLRNINKLAFIERRYKTKKRTFTKLDSKTEYQLNTDEFSKKIDPDGRYSGFIFSDKLYMFAIVPVYLNENSESNIGYLLLGREVNETKIESENLIGVNIVAVNPSIHPEQIQLLSKLKNNSIHHALTKNNTTSRFALTDINGKAVAIIEHIRTRPEVIHIAKVSWLSLLLVIGVSIILGYIIWWNRKRYLNKDVRRLENDIGDVRIGAELSSRLSADRRGILAGVVMALNQKIGGFEKTVVDNRKHNSEIILNELPLEAYLKDTALKYVAVNEKYCGSLGLDKDHIIGKLNSDLETSVVLDEVSNREESVIETKESVIFEEIIQTKNKGAVIYSIHLIPFVNAKGLVEGVVGVRIDITDQKHAEDEMEMAAKVLENTAEGFMVTNAERHIIHVNNAYTSMTGYEENELLGKVPLLLQSESRSKTYQEIQDKLEKNGTWKGELWSSRKDGSSYPEMINLKAINNKQGEVTNYFSMSKDITEEKKWEKQLYEMAHYDSLTGLPNRTLFQDRITQEIIRSGRNKKNISILFLDIDLFKAINDSLGHAAGDELLKVIASRLKITLRNADSIARMGGDEFTILVTDLAPEYEKNISYLKRLSGKIIDVVSQPMEIEGREISVTCSIGIAVYPIDASNVDDLIRNADSAMYHAKEQGRRNYQFYSKEFNESAIERLEKEIEFRAALKNGELELNYQPQVDVISRHVVGAEALLRWNKDGKNVLGPEKIIVLAEEIGLINELGNWILRTACLECKGWLDNGHKNLRVSVNLSTRQFRQKNLVEIVEDILEETELPGKYLELEVTESSLMESVEYSIEMMAELSRRGVRWSLDDFGTGYSSLNYLRDFPVHVLKIDQSFVREITINPEDSAIVETIIDLAHRLHLTVIAEGVENEDQLKALSRMNCELIQGYYFSKPRNKESFVEYISKGIRV